MIAYLVTNTVNGKRYVGITRRTLAVRWRCHIWESKKAHPHGALPLAIRKYGKAAFTMCSLSNCATWEDLCKLESKLIRELGTRSPHGYNLTDGGEGIVGYKYPRHIVEHIASMHRGNTHTVEARRLIGEAGKGRKKTPQGLASIAAAHKGKRLSLDHRRKLSMAKIGKKLPPRSQVHCARISDGLRRAWRARKGGS